ncbi:MAG: hydrogenase nickel incorporation protein HypB [Acidobacteria bacterium]|nr:hydrogenase nickel incorporation protein HypB [Acidobacteriota bacterium]
MCTTCGCGQGETRFEGEEPGHEHNHEHVHADGTVHSHAHDHDHGPGSDGSRHEHGHGPHRRRLHLHFGLGPAKTSAPGLGQRRLVEIEQRVLAKNDGFAAENRRLFRERGILALNLVSSPGSGKTTLLVETIARLREILPIAVIEGDQQTSFDADRIRAAGVPALQVNTGKGCHLDAHMVGHAADRLGLAEGGLLLIENVGNLVCPSGFDLGEAHKVVILSVTEGEDKPLKYPDMFAASTLMLLNKADLLPHLRFDTGRCLEGARRVNPGIRVIQTSAVSGEGLEAWTAWILEERAKARG